MSYRERLGRLPDFSMGTRFNPNALIAAGLPIAPIVEHGSWQTGEPDILRWDISRGVGQTPAHACPPGTVWMADGQGGGACANLMAMRQTAVRPWQIMAGVLGVGGLVALVAGKRLIGAAALGGAGYSYYKSRRAQGWTLWSM